MTGRWVTCIAGGVAWAVGGGLAATVAAAGWEVPLVVTQLPRASRSAGGGMDRGALISPAAFDGARLVVVAPGGQPRVLSEGFDSACDPNVSFDGQRVLFAGRRAPGTPWRIWEVGLDGQGMRPVSPEGLEARSPLHVSTLFTLDSPQPWYTTVFVGREATLNERGQSGVWSLYNVKLEGTELRRLTYNPNANLDPFQMWDGRVIYAAERYPLHAGAAAPHAGIYAIHIEGADMELCGGGRGRRIQRTPCATESGLIVVVESDAPTADGSGQLGCFEERRPHVTHRVLTDDRAFVYRYPAPWTGSKVLVSRRPARGQGNWGIQVLDTTQGTCDPGFDTPDYHEVQAVAVRTRPRPDGHSTVVESRHTTGIFYGLNCYDAEARMAPHLQTGMVKRVRWIEGIPATSPRDPDRRLAAAPVMPRRLVGEAPVEADGSFNVEVPADIPLLLQMLDERGMALATCGWIWVKPREKRGCIGCHEDPERIPENHYVLALQRPSNHLVLSPAQRRHVTFRDDIAPMLQTHCATADCHGRPRQDLHLPLTGSPPSETDLRRAYARLMAPGKDAPKPARNALGRGRYVDAGSARTSRLAWHLMGTRTTRPWDDADGENPRAGEVALMPPPDKGKPLSPEQRRTLVQWMDLGAPFEVPAPDPESPPNPRQP